MKTSQHVPPLVRTLARMSSVCLICQSGLQAAELKYSLAPEAENFQLGSRIIAAGDLNGDGITEIAVADQSFVAAPRILGSGIVYLLNGADGSLIRSFQGTPAPFQSFGFSLVALNADGDDIPDLAIGASGQGDLNGPGAGAVWIHSGADGKLISTTIGPSGSAYGTALANAGDQDGDGLDDLFVGAPRANSSRGRVMLQSSINHGILWQIDSGASLSGFGSHIVDLDDLDSDGFRDLAVAAPDFRDTSGSVGRVTIFRSSDRSSVAERIGAGFYKLLGYSMAEVPDADDDGHGDLMLGSYNGGTCLIVSGTNLNLIADLSDPSIAPYQPTSAGGSFDADGDGISDWLFGSTGMTRVNTDAFGGVRILSGADKSPLFSLDAPMSRTGFANRLAILPGLGIAITESNHTDPLTKGRGLVHIWEFEQFEADQDRDGDGVNDDVDANPDSDTRPTVVIFGVDSGVENRIDPEGLSIADHFAGFEKPKDRKQSLSTFVAINKVSRSLYRSGVITKDESKALHHAAVSSLVKQNKVAQSSKTPAKAVVPDPTEKINSGRSGRGRR